MESLTKIPKSRRFADKARLREIMDAIDARTGFVHDPTATAQKAREMMLAQGIRPEENAFSRDIIRVKYPDESETRE